MKITRPSRRLIKVRYPVGGGNMSRKLPLHADYYKNTQEHCLLVKRIPIGFHRLRCFIWNYKDHNYIMLCITIWYIAILIFNSFYFHSSYNFQLILVHLILHPLDMVLALSNEIEERTHDASTQFLRFLLSCESKCNLSIPLLRIFNFCVCLRAVDICYCLDDNHQIPSYFLMRCGVIRM